MPFFFHGTSGAMGAYVARHSELTLVLQRFFKQRSLSYCGCGLVPRIYGADGSHCVIFVLSNTARLCCRAKAIGCTRAWHIDLLARQKAVWSGVGGDVQTCSDLALQSVSFAYLSSHFHDGVLCWAASLRCCFSCFRASGFSLALLLIWLNVQFTCTFWLFLLPTPLSLASSFMT